MIRSLRKGQSSLYIQHVHTGHTLGAEKFECEVNGRKAILRLSIKPIDQNQRMDERYLHEEDLVSVSVDDSTVIVGLEQYTSARRAEFDTWELQLFSQGKTLCFEVVPQFEQHNVLQILKLSVVGNGTEQRISLADI